MIFNCVGEMAMRVKVKDFLEKWAGNYIIENENGSVCGEGGKDGNSLTDNVLNENIINIRLDRNMWTEKGGEVILIIKDNQ